MKHQRDILRNLSNPKKDELADSLNDDGLVTFKKKPSSYELRSGNFLWISESKGNRTIWDYVTVREWLHILPPNYDEFKSFLADIQTPQTYNVANRVNKATLLRNIKCVRYILNNTFAYTSLMTKNQWRNKLYQCHAHMTIDNVNLYVRFNIPHLFAEAFLVGYLIPANYMTHRVVEQENIQRPVIDKITGKPTTENRSVKWTMYSPQYIHQKTTFDSVFFWRWAYTQYGDPFTTRERTSRLDPDSFTYRSGDRVEKRRSGTKHLKRLQLNEKGRPYRPTVKKPTPDEIEILNQRIEYLTAMARTDGNSSEDEEVSFEELVQTVLEKGSEEQIAYFMNGGLNDETKP